MSTEDLYNWVGLRGSSEQVRAKRVQFVRHVFSNEFLPHCGPRPADKAFLLGLAVRKLLRRSLGEICSDDIDSYRNKRFSTAGTLLAVLTRQLVRNFLKTVHIQIFKAVNNNKHINMTDRML